MSDIAPRRLAVERPAHDTLDENIVSAKNKLKCRLCSTAHPLRKCPKFLKMSPAKRLSAVRRHNYCMNCLAHSHFVRECRSRDRCMKCWQQHHTMLHFHHRADGHGNTHQHLTNSKAPIKKEAGQRKRPIKRRRKESATHNQALPRTCTCSASNNNAVATASTPNAGATIVINVLSRQ